MQTPHILIVEDESVTRNTLKSIFEAEGYMVHEATDGAEMHRALSEHDINLVIMDINLPGKNGLLLARELREHASVALMFLTGRDNEVDKILGLEIGADDYITKPFNPRELTIRAHNLLSRTMNLGALLRSANWWKAINSTAGSLISIAVRCSALTVRVISCRAANSAPCCILRESRQDPIPRRAVEKNDRPRAQGPRPYRGRHHPPHPKTF